MTIVVTSPYDQLAELEQRLGQRALARVLGKSPRLVWSWLHEGRRLQKSSVTVISGAAEVVERLSAIREFRRGELESLLEREWPALDAVPADLIRARRAAEVVAVLEREEGRVVPVEEVEVPEWKRELIQELEESLEVRMTDGPLYETLVFLQGLSEHDATRFVADARRALATFESEQEWEAFLAPYWAAFTPATRPAPAIASPFQHDLVDEDELDELIIPIGAMASARYPRLV